MLTDLQRVVLVQLRQRNLTLIAEQSEQSWNRGRQSYFDARARCPRWLRQLFHEANGETIKASPKVAERCASEPFAWRPRRRKSPRAHEWKIVSVRETAPDALPYCEKPDDAVAYWREHVAKAPAFNPEVECFVVILLNVKKRIRGHHLVSIGSLNETIAHPREVFRAAVVGSAWGVVLMHNHPSGEPEPSQADLTLTKVFVEAGRLLRIDVTDHIIVGHERHCSFRQAGLI